MLCAVVGSEIYNATEPMLLSQSYAPLDSSACGVHCYCICMQIIIKKSLRHCRALSKGICNVVATPHWPVEPPKRKAVTVT